MGHSQYVKQTWLHEIKVCRREGVAADWTDGANFDLFTVGGDAILVYNIWGIVTTTLGVGAALPRFSFTPTTGGGVINISGIMTTVAGILSGTVLVWDGVTATIPLPSAQRGWADSAEAGWNGDPGILPAGVVRITLGVACNAGVVDFYIAYLPCSNASQVIAIPG